MKRQLNTETIIDRLEKNLDKIHTYGVQRIGLFGSFSKGRQSKRSDIDLLVKFKEPTFDNYMDLKFFLEKILKKKVDLVSEDCLKPSLEYIKKEAIYAE